VHIILCYVPCISLNIHHIKNVSIKGVEHNESYILCYVPIFCMISHFEEN
jgi:hypothetical protein